MDEKQRIRRAHILNRDRLSDLEVRMYSEKICGRLKEFLGMKQNLKEDGVYGYYPFGKEVSLLALYDWLLELEIPLAFPKVSGDTMDFYQVFSMEEFQVGAFHIMEPKERFGQVNFSRAYCLVPGSTFDRTGNRYGYGKGYYDRYFSKHKGLYRVGVSYESQMEDVIWAAEYDIKMQATVTEHRIYFF